MSDKEDGKELGRLIEKVEHLSQTITDGFGSLECRPNTERITEMYTWYTDHKEIKKHIVKTVIKIFLPAAATVIAGCSAVATYMKG